MQVRVQMHAVLCSARTCSSTLWPLKPYILLPNRSGWARDRFGLTAGAQEWLDRFEASAFRMSDGQSLEDWQERGPEKQETRQPEGVYSGYGKKIDKLSTELDEMTARMEALLGKAGP